MGASAVEVILNPTDIWAWVGLAGDVADVAIPFVGGIGEAVDMMKMTRRVVGSADNLDELIDTGDAVITSAKRLRSSAVKKAWKNEVALVESTGIGSRNWTTFEIEELLNTGKVKGYVGHHMKSVKGYPELAGDPLNIQFLTHQEHLLAHRGNWRNITHGRYMP